MLDQLVIMDNANVPIEADEEWLTLDDAVEESTSNKDKRVTTVIPNQSAKPIGNPRGENDAQNVQRN